MEVSHPAYYWAKYLLSKRQFTYDQILAQMAAKDLGGLEPTELEIIEDTMSFPRPFLPFMKNHDSSQDFLKEERIYEMWHPDIHMKLAISILDNQKMRKNVEVMSLAPFSPSRSVAKLNRTVGRELDFELSDKAFELFKHYFWCNDGMTSDDWGQFVLNNDRSNSDLLSLGTNVNSPNAGQVLLWKLGIGNLQRLEGHRGYVDIRNSAVAAISQIAHHTPSQEHASMLLKYARVFDIAQKGIEDTGGAQEDMVQSFKDFSMKYENPDVSPINSLSSDSISVPSLDMTEELEGLPERMENNNDVD